MEVDMKRFFLLLIIISLTFIPKVNSLEMETSAKSAILIDQNTGTVLYKKNEHEKLPMASMTKVMSLLLIMEKINDGTLTYDDEVTISDEASSMGGSQIFLQTGDKYKVRELLKSVAMASANDAVVALAEKTYGSKESFIEAMNQKAKDMGLKNTNFVNVHGLDEENHYSSAYDMAMMAKELLKYEDVLAFTSVYEEYLQKPDGSQIWLVNTNKLVRFYEGVDGLKTGYTQGAGYCLTATGKRNNLRLISVVMGEETIEMRSQDTVKLLNYGFNTYKVNMIKSKNEVLGKVKVEKGKVEYTEVVLVNDAIELLNVNDKISKYKFELSLDKVIAPVKKGEIIGNVKILDEEGKLINEVEITVNKAIEKANLWDLFLRNMKMVMAFK
ncbi:MAG: D-alanyl-D-alanine carboxypeptidase [Firmicutes bacterium]|nr:D-alanyl-D-alanine carboxypeptidase [Bacillota bacterium]